MLLLLILRLIIIERTPGWASEWMEAVLISMTAEPIVEDGAMEKHTDTEYVQVRKDKVNTLALGNMVMSFPASTYG